MLRGGTRERENSLLTTYWSESTLSSWWLGGPASCHESLNFVFQVALYLPSKRQESLHVGAKVDSVLPKLTELFHEPRVSTWDDCWFNTTCFVRGQWPNQGGFVRGIAVISQLGAIAVISQLGAHHKDRECFLRPTAWALTNANHETHSFIQVIFYTLHTTPYTLVNYTPNAQPQRQPYLTECIHSLVSESNPPTKRQLNVYYY